MEEGKEGGGLGWVEEAAVMSGQGEEDASQGSGMKWGDCRRI